MVIGNPCNKKFRTALLYRIIAGAPDVHRLQLNSKKMDGAHDPCWVPAANGIDSLEGYESESDEEVEVEEEEAS